MTGYFARVLCHPDYIHSRVFDNVAGAFDGALRDMGWHDDLGVPLIFGANIVGMYPKLVKDIRPEAIIVQLEARGSPWLEHLDYLRLLDRHPVLEYDAAMVSRWRNAKHCPIRYHRSLTRLRQDVEKTNDVLFYGGINSRREEILKAVLGTGLRCCFLDHRHWDQRDNMIERSKVALNIHYYREAPLEMVRLSYLLANGAFVLSEGSGGDYQMESMMAFVASQPDEIVRACQHWARQDNERALVARNGFQRFQQMRQEDVLRACLDAPQTRRVV